MKQPQFKEVCVFCAYFEKCPNPQYEDASDYDIYSRPFMQPEALDYQNRITSLEKLQQRMPVEEFEALTSVCTEKDLMPTALGISAFEWASARMDFKFVLMSGKEQVLDMVDAIMSMPYDEKTIYSVMLIEYEELLTKYEPLINIAKELSGLMDMFRGRDMKN